MEPIRVGVIGAGFVAELHLRVYGALGDAVKVTAIASRTPASAAALAARHGVPRVRPRTEDLLASDEVDVVDLCVPNAAHESLTVAAARSGKHVICEKPLTGCFVTHDPSGRRLTKREMLTIATDSADRMIAACRSAGVQLMYAENWAYMPAIDRARVLVTRAGGSILEVRGEESHHGSHSRAARRWEDCGGGALMMLGAHPIGAMLQLKRAEGLHRDGKPIRPSSVLAQVADLTQADSFDREKAYIRTGWEDVENWCTSILTFDDGSKGVVTASYNCVGGMRDVLDIYASNARIQCDLNRSAALQAYAPDPSVFGDEELAEKLETNAGWSFPAVAEDVLQGYRGEFEDFLRAVRTGSTPLSGAEFARDVVQVIYASYASAEEGREVDLVHDVLGRGEQ